MLNANWTKLYVCTCNLGLLNETRFVGFESSVTVALLLHNKWDRIGQYAVNIAEEIVCIASKSVDNYDSLADVQD